MTKFLILILAIQLIFTTVNAQIQWNENWAASCKFSDNPFKTVPTEGSACSSTCVGTSGCTHFSWSNNVCSLQSGHISKSNAVFTNDGWNSVCGLVASIYLFFY